MSKARGKGRSKRGEKPAHGYAPSTQAEYEAMMSSFSVDLSAYTTDASASSAMAGSSSAGTTPQTTSSHEGDGIIRNKSIKSPESVEISGPMEVDGSVKCEGSIAFFGDFSVRDKIEAYGDVNLDGNMTCK
jgi:hypothetical protein